MIQNFLLVGFLKNEEEKKLYESFLDEPTVQKQEEIERLFQIHVRKIQILSYFTKVLHFESKRFDKKIRKTNSIEQLVLDKGVTDGEDASIDVIQIESVNDVLDIDDLIKWVDLENFFEDKLLYEIVGKLSLKQKKILHAIFVKNMSEDELARKLGITKQAVNKAKNQALKKIKQGYELKKQR